MANPIAGQLIRILNVDASHTGFQDLSGALVDPTNVQLIVKDGTGATTTYNYPANIQKDSVGVYHMDIDTTAKAGVWTYAWKATGTGQAYTWSTFTVDPAPL